MLPETLAVLAEHDFIKGAESANRDRLADACRELLMANPVETADQIQARALINAELRYAIFGTVESEEIEVELDGLISPLIGLSNKVQAGLDPTYLLCQARVVRRMSNNGGPEITLKRMGRFVTQNDEIGAQYHDAVVLDKIKTDMQKAQSALALSAQRIPALAAHRLTQIGRVHEQLALTLPIPDQQQDDAA